MSRIELAVSLGGREPTRSHKNDAGLDLYAREGKWINPGDMVKVPLGASVAVPDGHMGLLVPRSSLAAKRGLWGQTGIIDSGYRGELTALVRNVVAQPTLIQPGDRIYQLVLVPIMIPRIKVVTELDETERGSGGFGSTGQK